jgi:hypothetical protein
MIGPAYFLSARLATISERHVSSCERTGRHANVTVSVRCTSLASCPPRGPPHFAFERHAERGEEGDSGCKVVNDDADVAVDIIDKG